VLQWDLTQSLGLIGQTQIPSQSPQIVSPVVIIITYLGQQMTLNIVAVNAYQASDINCQNNYASLIYAIVSDDCPCIRS
jgi:hypothetical protein